MNYFSLDPIPLVLQGEGHYGLRMTDISVTEEYVGLGLEQTSCQTGEFRVDCTTRQSAALSLVQILVILCSHWWNLTMLAPRSMP